MLPIGPLMIEHRLIERMAALMRHHSGSIAATPATDMRFIEKAADFIQTSADRCHHGKEEGIHLARMEKEDRRFFVPAMDYFTPQEQDGMLVEMYEFDRKTIHEHYSSLVRDSETCDT